MSRGGKDSIYRGGVEGVNRYIKNEVIDAYGLEIDWIEPVRKVYRLITKDRRILAYKKINYSVAELLFVFSAMEHLFNKGFYKLGRFIKTQAGSPYSQVDGDIYVISNWVEGEEGDYLKKSDLIATIRTLAELHETSKGFKPIEGSHIRSEWGHWINKFINRKDQLLEFKEIIINKKNKSDFEHLYLQAFDYFYHNAKEAIDILKASNYFDLCNKYSKENSLCHHDIAYHNVIIDNNGIANLVDFDYCLSDLRIHDIGSLIIRNLKEFGWEVDRASFILEQYNRFQPIASDEIKVMQGFIHFPQDYWQVAFTYFCEDIGRTEREAFRRLLRAVKMKKEREKFLKNYQMILR